MGADAVAGVVVALCGALTGLFSVMQSRRAGSTAADVQQQVAAPPLTISPLLHTEYTERLELAAGRETRLQELLRTSLRLVRRQNRRLAQAGLETEQVPAELIPYSID